MEKQSKAKKCPCFQCKGKPTECSQDVGDKRWYCAKCWADFSTGEGGEECSDVDRGATRNKATNSQTSKDGEIRTAGGAGDQKMKKPDNSNNALLTKLGNEFSIVFSFSDSGAQGAFRSTCTSAVKWYNQSAYLEVPLGCMGSTKTNLLFDDDEQEWFPVCFAKLKEKIPPFVPRPTIRAVVFDLYRYLRPLSIPAVDTELPSLIEKEVERLLRGNRKTRSQPEETRVAAADLADGPQRLVLRHPKSMEGIPHVQRLSVRGLRWDLDSWKQGIVEHKQIHLGDGFLQGWPDLQRVDFQSGLEEVERVGSGFLSSCPKLHHVNLSGLSKGLHTIGDHFMDRCLSLKKFTCDLSKLRKVGRCWLEACQYLKAADFSKCASLVEVGDRWLYECTLLSAVNFGGCSALVRVGDFWMAACRGLESLTLGPGLVSLHTVGSHWFWSCRSLLDLNCSSPDLTNLKVIGKNWLCDCESLVSADVSGFGLMSLPHDAFTRCTSLPVDRLICPSSLRASEVYWIQRYVAKQR